MTQAPMDGKNIRRLCKTCGRLSGILSPGAPDPLLALRGGPLEEL